MERNPIQSTSSNDGKTVAIISYLTIIGLIVAIIMNNKEKTSLGQFHIRQSIGISVTGMALGLLRFVPGIGGIAISIVGVILLIALILGLLAAFSGEKKALPFIGEKYQEWFNMI
ncbi:hypothetical protein HX021_01440 [Sphingobacterium sp. N143]|uniref:hypothetical protein n=1 Tax=Sphingobacterium sp. N143 TaxID=2746727 RepID=UPI0025764F9A|nr:hypothetical protein [Sphingobacterium sp. N143]MDM1292957.1 hypothetical protein [Sphingobacterium sp. N143]